MEFNNDNCRAKAKSIQPQYGTWKFKVIFFFSGKASASNNFELMNNSERAHGVTASSASFSRPSNA
jgi:hypothetical protein